MSVESLLGRLVEQRREVGPADAGRGLVLTSSGWVLLEEEAGPFCLLWDLDGQQKRKLVVLA